MDNLGISLEILASPNPIPCHYKVAKFCHSWANFASPEDEWSQAILLDHIKDVNNLHLIYIYIPKLVELCHSIW